jgi:hypothetical protein
MSDPGAIAATFLSCLDRCKAKTYPYRHWLLDGILPDDTCAAIDALPVQPPTVGDALGKRETNNSTRLFLGVPQRAAHPVCDALARAPQGDAVEPGSEAWGTDILDGPDRFVASAPYVRNGGPIFIPGAGTWHGFRRRPIAGVRRSLIVNYVRPEWRSRHELSYPQQPVPA